MKQCSRIALATLCLLAAAGPGLLTASGSDSGPILLPKINPPRNLFAEISVAGSAGNGKDVTTWWGGGVWKNGSWTSGEKKDATQFTIKFIPAPGVRTSQYNFEYTIRYQNKTLPEVTVIKHLPFTIGDTLPVAAPGPFLPVIIDASKLKWAAGPADSGLSQVRWIIRKDKERKVLWGYGGVLSAQKTQEADIFLTTEDDGVDFRINFDCVSKGNKSGSIRWADNGKDLRTLPSGPHIVLAQPACPE